MKFRPANEITDHEKKENIEKLIEFTDGDKTKDLLKKAELYRHLGKFNKARKYLLKVSDPDYARSPLKSL